MKLTALRGLLPGWKNAALALLSAILLILAFPDFEYWFLAWFALVPLMFAVEREKDSPARGFILGWIFGLVFFFGTCWWLTFAPITYAGFPPLLAYFLLVCATAIVAIFPGVFGLVLAVVLNRFGTVAILSAPFIWVFTEFLRYWLTGNNWNAIGYSQAFTYWFVPFGRLGGVLAVSFVLVGFQGLLLLWHYKNRQWLENNKVATPYILALAAIFGIWAFFSTSVRRKAAELNKGEPLEQRAALFYVLMIFVAPLIIGGFIGIFAMPAGYKPANLLLNADEPVVIAIQPNVPMSGLNYEKWRQLRRKHIELSETALATLNQQLTTDNRQPTTVIFPESPMNFAWDEDPEFQAFVSRFAATHNVNVLFNSAEPDPVNKKYFNSAVLINSQGKEVVQYDKIYLLPFGESVPAPLQSIVPAFVGSFSYGSEYDLLPLGDARAGVMICFESHFGELSREYVRNGADAIIEMTNDGYLGPTPVLRQHLANAVFRAVETNRPVLRVTNVGITAYINERGEVLDPAGSYTEDFRVWSVAKSDGSRTFYVKFGDWFAWLCTVVSIALLAVSVFGNRLVGNRKIASE